MLHSLPSLFWVCTHYPHLFGIIYSLVFMSECVCPSLVRCGNVNFAQLSTSTFHISLRALQHESDVSGWCLMKCCPLGVRGRCDWLGYKLPAVDECVCRQAGCEKLCEMHAFTKELHLMQSLDFQDLLEQVCKNYNCVRALLFGFYSLR